MAVAINIGYGCQMAVTILEYADGNNASSSAWAWTLVIEVVVLNLTRLPLLAEETEDDRERYVEQHLLTNFRK